MVGWIRHRVLSRNLLEYFCGGLLYFYLFLDTYPKRKMRYGVIIRRWRQLADTSYIIRDIR